MLPSRASASVAAGSSFQPVGVALPPSLPELPWRRPPKAAPRRLVSCRKTLVVATETAVTAGRVVCGATRIWSHLLRLGLQERLSDLALPHRKRARAAFILFKMRPCSVANEISQPRSTNRQPTYLRLPAWRVGEFMVFFNSLPVPTLIS